MKQKRQTLQPLTDAEGLLTHIGIHPDEALTTDSEVFARCPGHKKRTGHPDRSPSWSINRETGKHWCFSCGYGGDAQGLVMDQLGIGPWEAIGMVRSWGLDPSEVREFVLAERPQKMVYTVPEDYLDGYSTPPPSALAARGLSAAACARYGVLWDEAKEAWILPIRTPTGDLMGYQIKAGPYVRNRPAKNGQTPGVQKGETWFGWSVSTGDPVVVVESPLDVVRLSSIGIHSGVAVMGQHPTTAQMQLLVDSDSAAVVLALDNDREGKVAIQRLIAKWSSVVPMKVFDYGDTGAKDPGDMSKVEIHAGITNAVPPHLWRP